MKNKYSSIFSNMFLLIISIIAIIIGWFIANESYWIILNCLVDDFRSTVASSVWIMYVLFIVSWVNFCIMIYNNLIEGIKPKRYIASLNDPKCFKARDLGIIKRTKQKKKEKRGEK